MANPKRVTRGSTKTEAMDHAAEEDARARRKEFNKQQKINREAREVNA